MAGEERLRELASDLERTAEGLVDVAMDVLREAVAQDREEARRAATAREKTINRARNAVERAARLVRQAAGESAREEW